MDAGDQLELVRELLAQPDDEARRQLVTRQLHHRSTADKESLLGALKDVSERHLVADAEVAARPRHLALGLIARADALRVQGQFPAAVAAYDQAGALSRKLREPVTWARTRTGWVLAMHYVGRGQEVLGVADEALRVLLDHQEFLRAGGLSLNSGLVCYELGQYARSLQLYQRAELLYERAAEANPEQRSLADERIAKAKANMALNQALLGDFDQAISLYEAARNVFVQHAEQDMALRVDHYIATMCMPTPWLPPSELGWPIRSSRSHLK
jgi:tetratricopeptide (TPR) repeat protein